MRLTDVYRAPLRSWPLRTGTVRGPERGPSLARSACVSLQPRLDSRLVLSDAIGAEYGGVLVSTLQVRQRRHAEDGSLASLITRTKK